MILFLKKNSKKIILYFIAIGLVVVLFYSNTTISYLFKDKIMIHRVNSIEKLNEVSQKYVGVELDVVYDSISNYFDVNHPPARSIQLNLKQYLSKSNSFKDLVYWIDFKNLSNSNKEMSLIELNHITASLSIPKKNIIVETTSPEFIEGFESAGYLTSYYLPPYLYSKTKDSLTYYIKQIKNKCTEHKTDYISFDSKDYSIVKEYFPDYKKISWYTGESSRLKKIPSKINLYRILLDNNIDYFLFPYLSKNGER